MKPSTQVKSVIICDDIRREHNEKAFFIGVFSGDILMSQLPANILLSFWFSGLTNQSHAVFEIDIALTTKSDNKVTQLFRNTVENTIKEKIPDEATKEFHLALIGLPVPIEEQSTLTVKWRNINGRWKMLSEKNISIQT